MFLQCTLFITLGMVLPTRDDHHIAIRYLHMFINSEFKTQIHHDMNIKHKFITTPSTRKPSVASFNCFYTSCLVIFRLLEYIYHMHSLVPRTFLNHADPNPSDRNNAINCSNSSIFFLDNRNSSSNCFVYSFRSL